MKLPFIGQKEILYFEKKKSCIQPKHALLPLTVSPNDVSPNTEYLEKYL